MLVIMLLFDEAIKTNWHPTTQRNNNSNLRPKCERQNIFSEKKIKNEKLFPSLGNFGLLSFFFAMIKSRHFVGIVRIGGVNFSFIEYGLWPHDEKVQNRRRTFFSCADAPYYYNIYVYVVIAILCSLQNNHESKIVPIFTRTNLQKHWASLNSFCC